MPDKTLALVNSTGRQAASVARAAAALGYNVRAQIFINDGPVAQELEDLPNVTVIQGSLTNNDLLAELFKGAHKAFINTLSWGDELAIGKQVADAAKKAGVQHYVYSSMPDHGIYGKGWPSLIHWSVKYNIEQYIRQIGLPATFVYTGIYNNNFTSLPYPLFGMKLQASGGFKWIAPFPPDTRLPWLDAEHDIGPAVVQILKDGLQKWSSKRIALAYELLTPKEVCAAFSKALQRPVKYEQGPIKIEVSIPSGYREQLEGIEVLFGRYNAPYFGPDLRAPDDAIALWEGYRGIEEYAREVFPVEEAANGQTWMH